MVSGANRDKSQAYVARWHHAPLHYYLPNNTYIVTASTREKTHFFRSSERLSFLQTSVLSALVEKDWSVHAWAFFPNHYHFVAIAPEDARSLRTALQKAHSQSARHVNRLDEAPGRQVWFQYWDTCITSKRSYLARLKYVHFNPVKHGMSERAEDYPFCSARLLMHEAPPDTRETILSMPIDRLRIRDDF